MTIQQIIKDVKWKEVERSLSYFYPDMNTKKYKKVFTYLCSVKKRKQKDVDEELKINTCGGEDNVKIDNIYYHTHTNKYSLSFRRWAEVSNLNISKDTLDHYKREEIIAHFIYEITWYGMEDRMIKVGKELSASVKKAKKEINNLK